MSKKKKTQQNDYEKMHEEHIIEWMKNDKKCAPSHSYNAYVYVRDNTTALGLVFYLHSLGFKVGDMYVQPWHISEFMHMENKVISVIGDRVGYGGIFSTSNGRYMTDEEIYDALDEHITSMSKRISERDDDKLTFWDRDFMAKRVINCGTDYKMFKVVVDWNDDDIHSKLIVNSRDPEKPHLQFPFSNVETIEEYNEKYNIYREATIDDIIEYFSGKGSWDHKPKMCAKVMGDRLRIIRFEDEI